MARVTDGASRLAKTERCALAALLRWWREDVKPREPYEDNPASGGWAYDKVWNAAKALHYARRDWKKTRASNAKDQSAGEARSSCSIPDYRTEK